MSRPALEVADIFRDHGPAWREANRGHVSLGQLKVMSAIERCRTAALGGHVARCENGACGHTVIAYNSCRNRHCPKCQGAAARDWLAEREAELLPVPYFHVVFTLPAELRDIAYQNKARRSTTCCSRRRPRRRCTIAADPKHLGARIGITVGAAHLGLGDDPSSARAHDRAGRRPLARRRSAGSRAGPTSSCPCACSRACSAGRCWRCWLRGARGRQARRSSARTPRSPTQERSSAFLAPLRQIEWVVYCQAAVRRARGSARLSVALHPPRRHLEQPARRRRRRRRHVPLQGLSRRWPDALQDDDARHRRVHPPLPASTCCRRASIASATTACSPTATAPTTSPRRASCSPCRPPRVEPEPTERRATTRRAFYPRPCPCCGGRMIVIEVFARGCEPTVAGRHRLPIRIDTS